MHNVVWHFLAGIRDMIQHIPEKSSSGWQHNVLHVACKTCITFSINAVSTYVQVTVPQSLTQAPGYHIYWLLNLVTIQMVLPLNIHVFQKQFSVWTRQTTAHSSTLSISGYLAQVVGVSECC